MLRDSTRFERAAAIANARPPPQMPKDWAVIAAANSRRATPFGPQCFWGFLTAFD
jgi:hypothetical protein